MSIRFVFTTSLGLALLGTVPDAQAQAALRKPYIVQLADAPTAAYEGGVAGLAATRPAPGRRLDSAAQEVQRYTSHLDTRRAAALAQVPAATVLHRYTTVLNGFSALLTPAEVAKLRGLGGVLRVSEDQAMPLATSSTSSRFLGLGLQGGGWSRTDAQGRPVRGEDVIVGVLDSGIWPETASFSDHVDASGKPVPAGTPGAMAAYTPLPAGRFRGVCASGPGFPAGSCNNKVIGARFYSTNWLLNGQFLDIEFHSPRDSNGHGSHVAAIAAGNADAVVDVDGSRFTTSGVAPRARIAVYKVCWSIIRDGAPFGTCSTGDSVAAIDQAVRDGVDVINFSVGGSRDSFSDPVSVAFLNATRAGVFVATAAGNEGPGNEVAHVAPWTTTVGNSTHDRYTEASVRLANGRSFSGPSFQTEGLADRPLVLSTEAGATPFASLGATDQLALARCYNAQDRESIGASAAAAIDPARVAGRIVVCLRGGNALVNKAGVARAAGAAGLIIQNVASGPFASANSTFLLSYGLPAVHLNNSAEAAVLAAARAGINASFSPAAQVPGAVAPVMESGSSRGPNRADSSQLKPDLTAPGALVIAAHLPAGFNAAVRDGIVAGTPAAPGGAMIGGTSMASPHVAGAAALLRQQNPQWSPMAIKSALLTSASNTVRRADGSPDPDRWGYGAGHLAPNPALATTLVFEPSAQQLSDYAGRRLRGHGLNTATITHADVVGSATVVRTVTNRGTDPVTLEATATLPGYTVVVSPSTLSLAPGASRSLQVRITRAEAPLGEYRFGELRLRGSGQDLRSALTARGNAFVGSADLSDARATGARVLTVGTGYNGSLIGTAHGMVPAARERLSVRIGAPGAAPPQVCTPLAVASEASTLRVQLFNADTQGHGNTDLDLVLKNPQGQQAAASAGFTSDEWVEIRNPEAGTWEACIEGYSSLDGFASVGFVLSSWVLDPEHESGTLR